MSILAHQVGGRRFHNFDFDITTSESNAASELTLRANERYINMVVKPLAAWIAADIGVQVKLSGDVTNWHTLRNSSGLLVVTTPEILNLTIVPEQLAKMLDLPITTMRLSSLTTTTETPLNQTSATSVAVFFL